MIKKTKTGYRLVSKSGKNLGDSKTLKQAREREKQVQYFKHKEKQQ